MLKYGRVPIHELREPSKTMSVFEFVSENSRLAEIVDKTSSGTRVAVDIESNGFFRYPERVCLVQLATPEKAFLVDPLAITDVSPLGDLFSNGSVEKIFHAGDYDVRSIYRDWGFRINNLFDTSIAAAFVGSTSLGLQAVVEEYAGVKFTKNAKLQRSDWTIRPLTQEALAYAADDVLHLTGVRDVVSNRLNELGRHAWVDEEFARLENARFNPNGGEHAFISVKGSRDLDGRGLAILHSLFRFREREARRIDRPLFKVIQDSALIRLASEPEINLSKVKGLSRRYSRNPGSRRLRAAINEGRRSDPLSSPTPKSRFEQSSPEEGKKIKFRLRRLKEWRGDLGQRYGMDPSLLWPTVSLQRLARNSDHLGVEFASSEVRTWQRSEFGASLKQALDSILTREIDPVAPSLSTSV